MPPEDNSSNPESVVAGMVDEGSVKTGDNITDSTGNTEKPDNVPSKFWDEETKTVRHDDVLKSYSELESRFGSFTGAPENYEFKISEDMSAKLQESGIEIDTEGDPLYEAAVNMAKDTNMSQEGFEKLSEVFIMSQLASIEAEKSYQAEQMQQLGERAEARISNIEKWGERNLDPEMFDSLKNNLVSAAMVPVLEHLISSTRSAPVDVDSASSAPAVDPAELTKMQFERDANGNRRIATDPEFKAKYQKLMKEFYGDSENRIMVG